VKIQGALHAKQSVNNYLMKELPKRLVTYRNHWNLDDENLPEPIKYLTYEPIAIDSWPTLITVAISMDGLTRNDYTPTLDPVYDSEYSMRTYIWVKDDDSEQCTAKRDRLTTVLRSAFLDNLCLEKYAKGEDLGVEIEETSIREEYSDLTLLKGERVMAGSYVAYTLTMNETSYLDGKNPEDTYLGELAGIEIESENLLPLLKNL